MRKLTVLSAVLMSMMLASGCGGDGGDGVDTQLTAADTPAGLWLGTTATRRAITGLVLADGSYYVLYSRVDNPGVISGFVQGNATSGDSRLSSPNSKDFNLEGPGTQGVTLVATYESKRRLSGTISYPNADSTGFASTYDTAYEGTPSLASVAGTYTGLADLVVGSLSSTVVVSSAGALNGGSGGCTLAGTVSPRQDVNAYDVSFTFGSAPCLFAGQKFTGLGYLDAATKRLHLASTNAGRSDGTLFVGTKS